MTPVVCDTSVIFKLLVSENGSEQALVLVEEHQIVVPEFMFVELGSALWARVRMGLSRADDVPRLLDELDVFSFHVHPDRPLMRAALSLAMRLDHPIYDCTYLALAERENIPLVTADRRFLNALRRSKFETVDVRPLAAFA